MPKPAILCVDDERIVLDSLKTQIKSAFGNDYLYEIAESAEDALEAIAELHEENISVLLIVSDWLMPGMKGDEFLVKIRQLYPNTITIMLTGQADESSIERAKKEANLHSCLYKPWSEAELLGAIKSGLAQL